MKLQHQTKSICLKITAHAHQARSVLLRSLSNSYCDFFVISFLSLGFVLSSYLLLFVLRLKGESLEWWTYLLSGTLLPGILLLLGLWYKSQHIQKSKKISPLFQGKHISILLLCSYAVLISIAATRLIFWIDMIDWITEGFYKIFIFLFSFCLVICAFFNLIKVTLYKKQNLIFDGFAILILLCFSLKALQTIDLFHGGVFVGPIQLIRNGGHLLWDIPSQYGFLHVLIAAALPFKSALHSMLFLNSILFFISSLIFYFICVSKENNLIKKIVFLLITICFVFYVPGWFADLQGAYKYPSIGPMRFVWVYILLALLFFFPKHKGNYCFLLGNICWVISVIWSIESAVYATAIWIPAFYCMLSNNFTFKNHSKNIVLWLSPFLILGMVLLLISGYYLLKLGHLPDYASYADYALAFSGGFGVIRIDGTGVIWYFMLLFFIPCFALFKSISKPDYINRLPLSLGCFGGYWAVSSYFISRSHDNNWLNLSPVLLLIIIILIKKFPENKVKFSSYYSSIFSIAVIPILGLYLTHFVYNTKQVINKDLVNPHIIKSFLPMAGGRFDSLNKILTDLSNQNKITPEDPIIWLDYKILQDWTKENSIELTTNTWLPIYPMILFHPLTTNQGNKYLNRYIASHKKSGWLISHNIPQKFNNLNRQKKFMDVILQHYKPDLNMSYSYTEKGVTWDITWYNFIK